ncbi:TBC domain containing protein, putative [Babesia bigemina]|uniref:TBC domain containing protein, putative n=1 Tax=Babesia bigemina TaxID=5866 RepID=A0A061DAX5_BABBI|nr:TBC domain containing protein, putative [Babesia bigemina]CDR96074.1 TBC domain containing protein, putative [Babesia bigemina]|eukprot:XP_012768260.1 TBC domain containing protein, putative [Babesia bigemina]
MRLPWKTGRRIGTVTCVVLVAERQNECVKQQKTRRKEKTKVTQRMLNCVSNYERGSLWKRWVKTEEHRNALPRDIYRHLVAFDITELDVEIRKDIHRTFPQHTVFRDAKYAQDALFNVLKAYALYNPDVGYCQGMSFIAGMLVLYMNEEDAFFTMVGVMEKNDAKRLFLPQMPLLVRYCSVLDDYVRRKMRKLYRHLRTQDIDTAIIATQWFLTMFTYSFTLDAAALLWDVILARDGNFVVPIAIVILKLLEVGAD